MHGHAHIAPPTTCTPAHAHVQVTNQFKQDKVHLSWFMTTLQFAVYVGVTYIQTSLTKAADQRDLKADDPRKQPPLRCPYVHPPSPKLAPNCSSRVVLVSVPAEFHMCRVALAPT